MSIAVSVDLAAEPRSFSLGPRKMQLVRVNVVSGDTGATVTADNMASVDECLVCGGPVTLTAQPTMSGNVATLAFTDPAASRFLQCILIGR